MRWGERGGAGGKGKTPTSVAGVERYFIIIIRISSLLLDDDKFITNQLTKVDRLQLSLQFALKIFPPS